MDLLTLNETEAAVAREAVAAFRRVQADAQAEIERRLLVRSAMDSLAEAQAAEPGDMVIYAISQNTDLTEGKGSQVTRGRFWLQADAETADLLLDRGGWQYQSTVRPERIYASVEEWMADVSGEIGTPTVARLDMDAVKRWERGARA